VKRYFGSVVKLDNNKFSALNGAVWSGGSFVYIPQGVYLEVPLHNFFQMSTPSQGQFERTLIIADEGSSFEFIEGCVAPLYSEVSIHAGVVEIIVKKGARVKYSTMQNWSKNVMNLVTKSSYVEEEGVIEWVDGNIGSGVTMKYPSMVLAGPKARGQLLSLAFAGEGQVIDSGGKAIHLAKETSARIESKSVVKCGGRSTFRGDVIVSEEAANCRTSVECVSLHLHESARSDTYPRIDVRNASSIVDHESSVMKLNEEQLLYLRSRGLDAASARGLIIAGFIDPFTTELPLEYAVEFDRLVELEIKNGVG
jgi:Fe-S cluster assembly protein SufB